MSQENKIGKVKGKVIRSTAKAVLINVQPDLEIWFPKSCIRSKNNLNQIEAEQWFLVDSWKLEKHNIPLDGDFFIQSLKKNIREFHQDNFIALYGIGSYFNKELPSSWEKNDVDLILIVKSLDDIPIGAKENLFKSRKYGNFDVFIAYNTTDMYQSQEAFKKLSKSFSVNYLWALMNIKHEENSTLLCGEDIRDKLPDTNNIDFDYSDILARALYHIEKSLMKKDEKAVRTEFSKAVFKFSYYLNVFFDPNFYYTSIIKIKNKLKSIVQIVKNIQQIIDFLEKAINIRIKVSFNEDFIQLREKFIKFIFTRMLKGGLHKKFSVEEFSMYLGESFGGFVHLKRFWKAHQVEF